MGRRLVQATGLIPALWLGRPAEAQAVEAPPRCETSAELLAVVHYAKQPTRSFAMVDDGGGEGRMVGIGSHVAGGPVVAITPHAMWLRGGEDLCWLPLDHDVPTRARHKKKAKKRKRGKRK